jgi:hypothetical protein
LRSQLEYLQRATGIQAKISQVRSYIVHVKTLLALTIASGATSFESLHITSKNIPSCPEPHHILNSRTRKQDPQVHKYPALGKL